MNENQSFVDIKLGIFIKNNPHTKVSIEEREVVIETPWANADSRIIFSVDDENAFSIFNNILLYPKFDAIIHLDLNEIEFLYGFIQNNDQIIQRKFELYFSGKQIDCRFATPSERLLKISTYYQRVPNVSRYNTAQQLNVFKDSQRLESLSERNKQFFKNRIGLNFFLKFENIPTEKELEKISKNLNFAMLHFDRNSPFIVIRDEIISPNSDSQKPIQYLKESFPNSISLNPIDEVILQLIEVGTHSSPRFAYLYYYQVFEYSAYYYLDEKIKKNLLRFLKDPSIINCSDENISSLITIFSENNITDEAKIKKVIEECCDPKIIWREIENDKDFFSKLIVFDGGFEMKPLISLETTLEDWLTSWTKLADTLTKIRNVLVHAREKRENKVILPTANNNEKIERYIPVISRMANLIALNN